MSTVTATPATAKQLSFLESLAEQTGFSGVVDFDTFSKAEASDAISSMLELRDEQRKAKLAEHSEAAGTPLTDELPEGYYTVVLESGEHRTFRIKVASSQSKLAGKAIISYLSGSDNTSDYTGFGFVEGTQIKIWRRFSEDSTLADAAKILVGDPTAAQQGYAKVSGNCYICARTLTDPTSIDLGIGPVCRGDA